MERRTEVLVGTVEAIIILEEVVAARAIGGPGFEPECTVVPEKQYAGSKPPTAAGDLCRILKRITYLNTLLECELAFSAGILTPAQFVQCCKDAADTYCNDFDACPA